MHPGAGPDAGARPMTTKPGKLIKDGKRAKQLPRASAVVSALPIGD